MAYASKMSTDPNSLATRPAAVARPSPIRNIGLFAAGATFFALAQVITRRSLLKRYHSTVPTYFQPSTRPAMPVNGAMEAFEALNIATVNVISVSMMTGGGLLWAYDIRTLAEMRTRMRVAMGFDQGANEAEEEFEEWLATVLERKKEKEKNTDGSSRR